MTLFNPSKVKPVLSSASVSGAAGSAWNSRRPGGFRPEKGGNGSHRCRKLLAAVLLFLALLSGPAITYGVVLPPSSVSLAWNASPDLDVVGYRVYYGPASGSYTNSVDVGNVLTNRVGGLINGSPYYFAVTAYDAIGLESAFSNEVNYTPGSAFVQMKSVSPNQIVLSAIGPVGRSYDVQASTNLKNWTVVGSVTVGSIGSVNFTDTSSGNSPARYYRLKEKP